MSSWLDEKIGVPIFHIGAETVSPRRQDIELIAGTNITLAWADNPTTKRSEITITSTGGGGGGGWTDDGAIVRLTTAGDTVAIGAASMSGSEKLRLVGALRVEGAAVITTTASIGASPAQTGEVRLPSTGTLQWRNNAGSGDVVGLQKSGTDAVEIGSGSNPGTAGIHLNLPTGAAATVFVNGAQVAQFGSEFISIGNAPADAGAERYENNVFLAFRNAANSANIQALSVDGSNQLLIGLAAARPSGVIHDTASSTTHTLRVNGTQVAQVGATFLSVGVTPAASGALRLENNVSAAARDAGNANDIAILTVNASDTLIFGSTSATAGPNGFSYRTRTGTTHSWQVSTNVELTLSNTLLDAQDNNIATTGDFLLGSTVASAGDMRVNHGYTKKARNNANGADRTLMSWGVSGTDELTLGDSNTVTKVDGSRVDVNVGGSNAIQITGTSLNFYPGINTDFDIKGGGSKQLFGLDSSGTILNLGIFSNAATNFQSGDRIIHVNDRTAAPTGNPSGGGYLWSESGALRTREPNSEITQFAYRGISTGGTTRLVDKTADDLQTTNATVTTILTYTIPDNSVVTFRVVVNARNQTTAEQGGYVVHHSARRRSAGSAALIGTIVKDAFEDQASWDVTTTVSGNDFVVQVTGAASQTIDWHAWLEAFVWTP